MSTTWFLFCADAHSNEVVAATLQGLQASAEIAKEHECADGKKRYLYEVPEYSFASRLLKSQKDLKATLVIFRSQDGGKPAKWQFSQKKKVSVGSIKKKSDQLKAKPAIAIHQRKPPQKLPF